MPSLDQVITFGDYQLDRDSGRLLRGRTTLRLRPKTFAVLEYLVTHAGHLVGHDELLNAVWPDTHVTPSVLAGCIRELRRALCDDVRSARFVETAYRRGYRFIAASTPTQPTSRVVEQGTTAPMVRARRDLELAELARRFAQAVVGIIQGNSRRRRPHPTDARTARPRRTRKRRSDRSS